MDGQELEGTRTSGRPDCSRAICEDKREDCYLYARVPGFCTKISHYMKVIIFRLVPSAGVTSDRWGNFGHFLILPFRVIKNIFWHKTYSKDYADGNMRI